MSKLREAKHILRGAATYAVVPFQFAFKGSERWIQTSERVGAIAGMVAGVGLMFAAPPLMLLGGAAGALVLSVANWNGTPASKVFSGFVGFGLGLFVGLPIAAGMVTAATVGAVNRRLFPPTLAQDDAAAMPAPVDATATGGLTQKLGPDFKPAAEPAAAAPQQAAKPAANPPAPKA